MLATCLILAFPMIADHLVQRSNDPYTILWARLLSSSESERCTAAPALGAIGANKAVKPLRVCLDSAEGTERTYVALALLNLGYSDQEVIRAVEQYLDRDAESDLHFNMYLSLAMFNLREHNNLAFPKLTKYIENCPRDKGGLEAMDLAAYCKKSPKTAPAVVGLLSRVKAEVPPNSDSFHPANVAIRNLHYVLIAVMELGPAAKDSVPDLEKYLRNPPGKHTAIMAAIALISVEPGHRAALDCLSRTATQGDANMRRYIASYLGMSKSDIPNSLVILRLLLTHASAEASDFEMACTAFLNIGRADAPIMAVLRKRLTDKNRLVALSAARALAWMQPEDCEEPARVLLDGLRSKDDKIRDTTVRYFSSLKSPPKSLVPGLTAGLQD